MRHICILLFLLATALPAMGQNENRRVAILDIVNKDGSLTYGARLQIRQHLTFAMSHADGYEAYDRVDMSRIMDEHKFQRSGMVSDSQIKALGEMTGAQYVLVTEVSAHLESNIIIVSNLINVETALIEKASSPVVTSTDVGSIEWSCHYVVAGLLGIANSTITSEAHIFVNDFLPGNGRKDSPYSGYSESLYFPQGISFYPETWTPNARYNQNLEKLAKDILYNPDLAEIIIVGYGNGWRGSTNYNLKLGEKRAQVIADRLKAFGVPDRCIEINYKAGKQ